MECQIRYTVTLDFCLITSKDAAKNKLKWRTAFNVRRTNILSTCRSTIIAFNLFGALSAYQNIELVAVACCSIRNTERATLRKMWHALVRWRIFQDNLCSFVIPTIVHGEYFITIKTNKVVKWVVHKRLYGQSGSGQSNDNEGEGTNCVRHVHDKNNLKLVEFKKIVGIPNINFFRC